MDELLNDRYQLGEVLGSGGMGAVYRATDTRLGRTVAVKVLRGGALADETARARLRSEAHLAAAIHHPGVAQVFDLEEVSSSHGGMAFIVMQHVDGHSLAQLLRDRGPMPVDQVMSVVVQVAEGLAAAHEAGVVHRDLRPANIMLTPAGRTVLVDFGIAHSDASEPLTDTGTLVGTADFMSPEQAAGRRATPRSDLYALGLVAHTCLTGRPPFHRDSPVATALAQVNEDLPPLGPDVPPRVRDLVSALTAKDPADRPASASAVALQAAAIGATATIDLPATFELPAPSDVRPTEQIAKTTAIPVTAGRPRSRRPVVLAAVGLVAILLAVLGIRGLGSDEDPTVPNVVGMTADDASSAVRDAGMTPRPRTVDAAGKRADEVVRQSPAGGTSAPDDSTVVVVVASGRVEVPARSVTGRTYAEASAALEKLGFAVERRDVTQSADVGEVVALDRSGRLPDGSTITLSVAVAPVAAATPKPVAGDTPTAPGNAKGKAKGKKKVK